MCETSYSPALGAISFFFCWELFRWTGVVFRNIEMEDIICGDCLSLRPLQHGRMDLTPLVSNLDNLVSNPVSENLSPCCPNLRSSSVFLSSLGSTPTT